MFDKKKFDIEQREMVLRWDIEFYENHINAFKLGYVECLDEETYDREYAETCKLLQEAIIAHEKFVDMYAEYFI